MWNYYYQEENRRIGYAIIFLLLSLCFIQLSHNIDSLFPKPQDNLSSFIYEDNSK